MTPHIGKASGALPALGWFAAALAARAPFVARIEGVLDHDQSVVGLMSLDIAAGRRFPLFFDGQRYMGAVEAYVAAAFVRLFGHSPETVALAPWLAFGLFAAGQFVVWSHWRDRATGHLAALLTVLGSPMLAVWGAIPRGGYVEFLAWALPTLAVYQRVVRPDRPPPKALAQAGWGFLLGFGYFLNPLSLTVYVTIALDYTFGRHGGDLRRERGVPARWLDRPLAPVLWLSAAGVYVAALAACCHVDPRMTSSDSPYVAFGGLSGSRPGLVLGAAGVAALLAAAGWWTNGPKRLYAQISLQPWAVVGLLCAWSPFVVQAVGSRMGSLPPAPSLPVWIAAPWKSWPNVRTTLAAIGPLIGSDPRAMETVLIGQGIEPPAAGMPPVHAALLAMSPVVVGVAFLLILKSLAGESEYWTRAFALRDGGAAPPVPLTAGYLAVTLGLFLLQGTSPNASSVRYLVPLWVGIPGLLACGLRLLPLRAAVPAALLLIVPWTVAQWSMWVDMNRTAPTRPLARELLRRGVPAVVAPTPVALVVANLTHGAVGAVEYQAIWPRLGDRYRVRFPAGRPLTCVVDRRFPWAIRGEGAWAPEQDFGRRLRGLAARHPGRVRPVWSLGAFEVWEVDLPLAEVVAIEPDAPPRKSDAPATASRTPR